jgi:signal transduction histidine kinase
MGALWLVVAALLVAAGLPAPAAIEAARANEQLPLLTTAHEVCQLKREQARLGYPIHIRGVVTCVVPDHQAFVLQDATRGVFVRATGAAPRVGELWEVEGVTGPGSFAPIIVATGKKYLGPGTLPAPIKPDWDQLINGTLDDQLVKVRGVVESATYDPGGWSWVMLRTEGGVLRIDLPGSTVTAAQLAGYQKKLVAIEGCLFAMTDPETWQVVVGRVRIFGATFNLEQPDREDIFTTPRKSVTELKFFDPQASAFRRVKLTGQLLHVRGDIHFVLDGNAGVRVMATPDPTLRPGDLVEAVGFPRLSAAAPSLTEAVLRKTGTAELPPPIRIPEDELANLSHDATRVVVQGILASVRESAAGSVLEIQSGTWRFLARIAAPAGFIRSLRLGSRLELTGVYHAETGYQSLGADVAPIDLLLNSAADVRVLAAPSWWTPGRVLAVAGTLALLLVATLLWATLLRRKVEQRTRELGIEIQSREQAEKQRAIAQERARIAHDLHDELGADITEIGMLAARVRTTSNPAAERAECLEQMTTKTGQMVSSLEEIVWAMNPQHDSIASVVSYFSYYAGQFLGLTNIKLHLAASPLAADPALKAVPRHQLFLAFKEALTNIVHHSDARDVHLGFQVTDQTLHLTLADNGRGFAAIAPTAGQDGLTNMRERIAKLGGTLEIASQPGAGTTLKFSLPLN